MKLVYLAGAINGCTDAEAKDWRERVKAELADRYRFADPMDRDYRGQEAANVRTIVQGDKAAIRHAHLVLVNAARPSWGTAMEVLYAHGNGKHVVVIASAPVSPWLTYHASIVVPRIEEAIAYLRGLHEPARSPRLTREET